jgi:hypothetical protein
MEKEIINIAARFAMGKEHIINNLYRRWRYLKIHNQTPL